MQCHPTGTLVRVPPLLLGLNESALPRVESFSVKKRPKLHLRQEVLKRSGLDDLPDEVVVFILDQNLSCRDFCSLSQVSLRYRQIAVGVETNSYKHASGQGSEPVALFSVV